MGIEYVNRNGDLYYVHRGLTKTGKPRFWCSKKAGPSAVESLPNEFELHENPIQGTVSVRRRFVSRVTKAETDFVIAVVRGTTVGPYAIVDVEPGALVVYAPDMSAAEADRVIHALGGRRDKQTTLQDWLIRRSSYSPLFRFRCVSEDPRRFAIDRWCFRGSIDDWIELVPSGRLEDLAEYFLPHLGQESFYDLM